MIRYIYFDKTTLLSDAAICDTAADVAFNGKKILVCYIYRERV